MFKKMSVALLGGACTLVAGATSASAFDNTVPNDPPAVLYQPQVLPLVDREGHPCALLE